MTTFLSLQDSLDQIESSDFLDSTQIRYLRHDLVKVVYPALNATDQTLLVRGLVVIISFLGVRLRQDPAQFWTQLIQNNNLDLRALLNTLLPFIDDTPDDCNKHSLGALSDLYLAKDPETGGFKYTNVQHERFVRVRSKGGTPRAGIMRPYLAEYFWQQVGLYLATVDGIGNSLYVNWIDIVPVPFAPGRNIEHPLWMDTQRKIIYGEITLYLGYLDFSPGLSWQSIYQGVRNYLYQDIAPCKWVMFDIRDGSNQVYPYLKFFDQYLPLESVWNRRIWSQLTDTEREVFDRKWIEFLTTTVTPLPVIVVTFCYYFAKHYFQAEQLTKDGLFPVTRSFLQQFQALGDNVTQVNLDLTELAKTALAPVPAEHIYQFMYQQLTMFRNTWYYQYTKDVDYAPIGSIEANGRTYPITVKNMYNMAKSMVIDPVHQTGSSDGSHGKLVLLPESWYSLSQDQVQLFLSRLCNILMLPTGPNDPVFNQWRGESPNWFDLKGYLRKMHPGITDKEANELMPLLFESLQSYIGEAILFSMELRGALSQFIPTPRITQKANPTDPHKIRELSLLRFTGEIKQDYLDCHYWITGLSYREMGRNSSEAYPEPDRAIEYFDYLSSHQDWTFTYAMNWVSQIALYHRYFHKRVILVTGSTGVGKSTQIPKLIMYAHRILDHNSTTKIACTEPRTDPTIGNATRIAEEMGIPITEYHQSHGALTGRNYQIQYAHRYGKHINSIDQTFLRFATDGYLLQQIQKAPFLTSSIPDADALSIDGSGVPITWKRKYRHQRIYDILMVDEAHEHNPNMDLILTLMREAVAVNNALKLVIISATMKDDEPRYRRYYRNINDNRGYPLNLMIEQNALDRCNIDRRLHISPPNATTRYVVEDIYLTQAESDKITVDNHLDYAIAKAIAVAKDSNSGHILLFLMGREDIKIAVGAINLATPASVIAIPYFRNVGEYTVGLATKLNDRLPTFTKAKRDAMILSQSSDGEVRPGSYKKVIIVATNIAEASLTFQGVTRVIDSGYSKTLTYDPISNSEVLENLPISSSSSEQRKGRVGRTSPGKVYYLYSKCKLQKCKTRYQIANQDPSQMIVDLLSPNPDDIPIVYRYNDPNQIYRLRNAQYYPERLVSTAIPDYYPIESILVRQYFLPALTRIQPETTTETFFNYYGKGSYFSSPSNSIEWFQENHDDYRYQMSNVYARSQGYGGLLTDQVIDHKCDFFLVHPDENVLVRDDLSGAPIGIQKTPQVTEQYYRYLLQYRAWKKATSRAIRQSIPSVTLRKMCLALVRLRQQNIIVAAIRFQPSLLRKNISEHDAELLQYYSSSLKRRMPNRPVFATIVFQEMEALVRELQIDALTSNANKHWYLLGINRGMELDVLALIHMMSLGSLSSLKEKLYPWADFISQNQDPLGDVHRIWTLWTQIKKILISEGVTLDTETKRKSDLGSLEHSKRIFRSEQVGGRSALSTRNSALSEEQYRIIHNMYYSGVLDTKMEQVYYLRQISETKSPIPKRQLLVFAKAHHLDGATLISCVSDIISDHRKSMRKMWLLQAEYSRADSPLRVINRLGYTALRSNASEWDKMLEIYARAFASQAVANIQNQLYLIPDGIPTRIGTNMSGKQAITLISGLITGIYYSTSVQADPSDGMIKTPDIFWITPITLAQLARYHPVHTLLQVETEIDQALRGICVNANSQKIDRVNKALRSYLDINLVAAFLAAMYDPDLSASVTEVVSSFKK